IKSLKIKCKCNNYMDFLLKPELICRIIIIYCKSCNTEKDFFIKYAYLPDSGIEKILINLFKKQYINTLYTSYGFVYYEKKTTIIDKNDILINDWEDFKKILLLQDRQKIEEKYKQYILFM